MATNKTPEIDIEALKAELMAQLKAEMNLTAAKNKAPVEVPDPYYDELVEIELFKDDNEYKDDVFVACNGKRYMIRRGEPVMVPRKIALGLKYSMEQDRASAKYNESLQDEYRTSAKAHNVE